MRCYKFTKQLFQGHSNEMNQRAIDGQNINKSLFIRMTNHRRTRPLSLKQQREREREKGE